jgi:hypothetical protein
LGENPELMKKYKNKKKARKALKGDDTVNWYTDGYVTQPYS